ncbi:MAG: PadR family transcriptional regulator [Desulfurococcales archaeon]|nr:PadR family transcriptional regulator [Desulfurococcales archaeon]
MSEDIHSTKALARLKKKLTIENLWMYIVRILEKHGPLKAYEIKKKLAEEYGIKPATITVYIVVYKMRREKLLETVEVGGETLYKPSEKGVAALKEAKTILDWVRKALE